MIVEVGKRYAFKSKDDSETIIGKVVSHKHDHFTTILFVETDNGIRTVYYNDKNPTWKIEPSVDGVAVVKGLAGEGGIKL